MLNSTFASKNILLIADWYHLKLSSISFCSVVLLASSFGPDFLYISSRRSYITFRKLELGKWNYFPVTLFEGLAFKDWGQFLILILVFVHLFEHNSYYLLLFINERRNWLLQNFRAFDLIYEEIRLLLKDYDFLKEKMPDTSNLVMFHVNVKEYKMRIINNIEGYYIPKSCLEISKSSLNTTLIYW